MTSNPGGNADGMWLREVEIRGDEFARHDVYPFDLPLFQSRQVLRFMGAVSFFVGENGSGKSTLIDAIARCCGLHMWAEAKRRGAPPASWRTGGVVGPAGAAGAAAAQSGGPPLRGPAPGVAPGAKGGTAAQEGARPLPPRNLSDYVKVTVARGPVRGGLFSAESFREWAEFLDDIGQLDPGHAKYHGGADLTLRSRGEGLLAYFRGRYQTPGLYLLDEPESALSPTSQLALLRLLAEYRERGHAQFILATHSPILMALPGAQVFSFGEAGVEETAYQQTAHFRLYRDFMADPASFLATPTGGETSAPSAGDAGDPGAQGA
jgi:predicted ATPase